MTRTGQEDRLAAIKEALRILGATDDGTLRELLSQTRLNDDYRDPERLRERLQNTLQDDTEADLYIPYRAAQQILLAAGRPT